MTDHSAAGASDYAAAMTHRQTVLARVVLPARGLIGSRINQRRALLVRAALHQDKVSASSPDSRARHQPARCALCRVRIPTK